MLKPIILWEEDHPELLPEFQIDIEDMGYELVICKDAETACGYLEKNIELLSAAILDVDGYLKKTDEETDASFHRVRDKIHELRSRNPIEYFAFTGKAKYISDKPEFEKRFTKIFDKRSQSSDALSYLKLIVERHKETIIKSQYKEAFAVFEENEYGESIFDKSLSVQLVKVIDSWSNHSLKHSTMMFGVIRPIAEKTFHYLQTNGVIPDYIEEMNQKSLYLSALHKRYSREFPAYIARAYHTIFDVCPETLHDCETFDILNKGKTPFLLQSLTLELLNILDWFNRFVKNNPDYHTNLNKFNDVKFEYKKRRNGY